jgi:hypothetical protein
MSLSSVFQGNTLHFNKNAVPAWNEITSSLNIIPTEFFDTRDKEKEVLLEALTTTKIAVFDMLFHPSTGVIKNKVKSFDKPAFFVLYEIIILFFIATFRNIRPQESDQLKEVFIDALGRKEECGALWNKLNSPNNSEQIKTIVSKISVYAGPLEKKEESDLISVFRGLTVTFIDAI